MTGDRRGYGASRRAVLAVALAGGLAACAAPADKPRAEPSTATTKPKPREETTLSKSERAKLDRRLLTAAAEGDAEAVTAALADGANPETRDGSRRTPLLLAVTDDHVAAAKALVTAGADVNAVDDRSDTPWLVTGVTGSVDMMDTLLPHEPDFAATNRYGGIVLQPACERGHADYVAAVLERSDIDIDQVNDIGWTGLLEAIILGDGSRRYQDIVASLISHDVDVNLADSEGVRPLTHARRRGQDRVAKLLEQANAKA